MVSHWKYERLIVLKLEREEVIKNIRIVSALVLTSLVAACSTPRESCISDATSDYRTLQSLISEAQQNISRGYALHSETVPYTVQGICYRTDPNTYQSIPYSCPSTQYRTQTTPVSIDVNAERAKLKRYQTFLPEYAAQANAAV